jgi:hypothetical protein
MSSNDVGLSGVQIDALFSALTPDALSDLDLKMWQSRIYEDGDNPLQMMREVVQANQLTQDDLLFQMKLRAWGNPLDYKGCHAALRNLDQSMSDVQIRSLFNQVRNDDGTVTIADLVRNLTGKPYETADFRNATYKKIYKEIYPDQEDRILTLLQTEDETNIGLISAKSLLSVLL